MHKSSNEEDTCINWTRPLISGDLVNSVLSRNIVNFLLLGWSFTRTTIARDLIEIVILGIVQKQSRSLFLALLFSLQAQWMFEEPAHFQSKIKATFIYFNQPQ